MDLMEKAKNYDDDGLRLSIILGVIIGIIILAGFLALEGIRMIAGL